MNIFYTSSCPIESANNLCKVHIIKMIVEGFQIMSTVHRVLDGDEHADNVGMYRKTHQSHPCVKWCMENVNNYNWLYSHSKALCELYTKISGKVHKCDLMLSEVLIEPPKRISKREFTVPPKCMPDDIKGMYSDVAKSYKYYLNVKYKEWVDRAKPMRVEYPHLNEKPLWLEI